MFKQIYNLWFGPIEQAKPKVSDKLNSISFYIDEWDRPFVYINIENTNEMATAEFGKLLYLINSGKYEKNILDQMVELSNKKPLLKKSVQDSLIAWASFVTQNIETDTEIPYVRPTQVFK